MEGGPVFLYCFDKISKVMYIMIRMNTSNYVNLCDLLIVEFLHDVKHLSNGKVPAFRITGAFMIRAEPAVVNTFIGWLDMKITVEIYQIAILSSSHQTRKYSKKRKLCLPEELQPIFRRYPFAFSNFLRYSLYIT